LIETIGIGQDQIDVAGIAQMVLTVVSAGSGDDVQALKAGLFEVTDFLVINKADLPGTDELQAQFAAAPAFERVPIVKVSALRSSGIAVLIDQIEAGLERAATAADRQRRSMAVARWQLLALVRDGLMDRLREKIGEDRIESRVRRIAERRQDPYSAARSILAKIGF
jgi:LAO/AO transport system kinase